MIMTTATEFKNNFGVFLQKVQEGNDVIITKNGKEVARLISSERSISFLTDELTGVLKNDYDDKKLAAERMERRESAD